MCTHHLSTEGNNDVTLFIMITNEENNTPRPHPHPLYRLIIYSYLQKLYTAVVQSQIHSHHLCHLSHSYHLPVRTSPLSHLSPLWALSYVTPDSISNTHNHGNDVIGYFLLSRLLFRSSFRKRISQIVQNSENGWKTAEGKYK